MANFNTLEQSRQDSRPVEFYRFTIGPDEYLYTSAEDDIVIGGDTWVASSISRGKVTSGTEQKNRGVEVRMPAGNDVAQLYVNVPPGERAQLTILRGQRDESPAWNTLQLVHVGKLNAPVFRENGHVAVFMSTSVEADLSKLSPVYTYGPSCDNILYGPGCGVDPGPFTLSSTVTAVTSNVLTISGVNASGLDFISGYVQLSGENDYRLVVAQSGDDLTLWLPFGTGTLGAAVTVRAGCDHLVEGDCALVFDNVINFAGFHKRPTKDAFRTGLK